MLLTEEEAKTKWCPEVRTGVHAGASAVAVNRSYVDVTEETRCIGSACMAWRWEYTRPENAVAGERWRGWCGKAGPPNA